MATGYAVVYTRAPDSEWPVDIGDDPAIMAAAMPGPGVITWGICRRRERNRVGRDDVIVFFAADRLSDRRPARYCWIGYGTVDWKVSQTDIWTVDELAGLRGYPNLLIRPSGSGYVHCEQWHPDWIWRLTDVPRILKTAYEDLEATNALSPDSEIGGQPIEIASNYVIFRPEGDGTFIAANPPVVAHSHVNGSPETWERTAVAIDLQDLTLGSGATRARLRTRNKRDPHTPPARLATEASELRAGLDRFIERHGIRSRNSASAG
jgi:hypothetical protein